MATCTITGTINDCTGTAIVGAPVMFNTQDVGFSVEPVGGSTTTASDGTWSLAILQGTSGQFTIKVYDGSTGSLTPYTFNAVIPATSSATFASILEDNS